jgi:glucose-1-phosphate thymidylyltransferase
MAGLGTRMRPHTWSKPKPLIHLAGATVLDYVIMQFQSLPRFSEARFVLILGPNQEEQVVPHMKENYPDMDVHYVTQKVMRGQSDALYLAKEFLQGPMLMAFSDTLIDSDLSFLDEEPHDGIAWVKPVEDPRRFGVAEINDDGIVQRLIEKPKEMDNNLVVVGFYYFNSGKALMAAIEKQMAQDISLNGEFFLADAINIYIQNGAKMRVQPVDIWLDAGKPDALLETNRYLLANGHDNTNKLDQRINVSIIPPVYIHPDADIRDSIIGPHTSIGKDVLIVDSVLKNSIVEQGATIKKMILEDSLIGRSAEVYGRAEIMNIGDNSWIEI